ncbi:MAG: serine/threonine protein kinase [Pseudomonadota bacterium]
MIKRFILKPLLYFVGLIVIAIAVVQVFAVRSINAALDEPPLPITAVPASAPIDAVTDVHTGSEPRSVIFVGNNWQGTITVIDADDYSVRGVLNGIPDKQARLEEIKSGFLHRMLFYGIRQLVGEGHNQYVDDMYSTLDGRQLIVSRPSFADVVAIDVESGQVDWRFEVAGFRSDHMALSPDGRHVAVSASTGNVVHVIDVATGREFGRFPSGDSPHENVYSKDGSHIFHASIGRVFSAFDTDGGGVLKGQRLFQIVDANTMEVIERFDMRDKLDEFGREDVSPAIRPMAHTSDERVFYFQLSFLHGFIEYDLDEGAITRLVDLPKVTTLDRTDYVNDSAHHGIAISGDDQRLCIAGTMDDYAAIVNLATMEKRVLQGLGEKPYWVVTDQSGEHCFVSWSGTDQMSVIRYADAVEVKRVDVGDHPQRIREGYVTAAWYAAHTANPTSESVSSRPD